MQRSIVEDQAPGKGSAGRAGSIGGENLPLVRLFVAISLPPEVLERLAALRDELPGLAWSRPETMHLTLRFIGSLPETSVPVAASALRAVRAAPFSLRLRGFGLFGGSRRGVFWAGPAPSPQLFAFKRDVDASLEAGLGLAPEHGAYRPHITLSRLKTAAPAGLRQFVGANSARFLGEFLVTSFSLFRGSLQPGGVVHRPEAVYSLPPVDCIIPI